jgi:hypothetical protein
MIIRSRKSAITQHNVHKKKNKRTNNGLQNTTQKTKDGSTQTQQKSGGELRWPGRVSLEIKLYTCTRLTFSYHQIFEKINMKGANGGTRTAYPSRPPEFTPGFLFV